MKNFLANILKSVATPGQRSSAELKGDLAKIDLAALEVEVEAVERRRRLALLRGTDDEVAAITADLAAVNLQAERGQALVDELQHQIMRAKEREIAMQLDAESDIAQRAAERLTEVYSAVDDHAQKVKALLVEAFAAADTLSRWNRKTEKIAQPHRRINYADPASVKQRLVGTFR